MPPDPEDDEYREIELEMEAILESLYSPGCYEHGEGLCLDIMEEIDPDWEPARLFLMLNLAAMDQEEEALEMVDELSDSALLRALRELAFGAGTEAEESLYEDIILCAQERGLEPQLEKFFETREQPWERHQTIQLKGVPQLDSSPESGITEYPVR